MVDTPVACGDRLCCIETAFATAELPSPFGGTIVHIKKASKLTFRGGDTLAIIKMDASTQKVDSATDEEPKNHHTANQSIGYGIEATRIIATSIVITLLGLYTWLLAERRGWMLAISLLCGVLLLKFAIHWLLTRRADKLDLEAVERAWLPEVACKTCGYNLVNNASGVCPECGRATDTSTSTKET